MLKDQFKTEFPTLTDAEKKIINTIDEQINSIDNFSITNIAKLTYSSTTSINRLAKKLNLTYSDFKFVLHNYQQNYYSNESKTQIYVDSEQLNQSIENINAANTIYIIGVGQSAHISRYMFDILFKMGYNCHIITDADLITNLVTKVKTNDYIIYISSSGSTSTLVSAAESQNCKSLVITSNNECALQAYCDNILISNSDLITYNSYSFSLQSGLMQIIDTLIVKLLI